ncbi:hypothetical protein L1887_10035 [Cichorium endivia]|nr:hypothetical protein L1887_10035 [Cichorium endivia]
MYKKRSKVEWKAGRSKIITKKKSYKNDYKKPSISLSPSLAPLPSFSLYSLLTLLTISSPLFSNATTYPCFSSILIR